MPKTYSEKRNADKTPEPQFEIPEESDAPLKFVVQLHHASHLHFDFRLECDGVLKSWAVPKGPSMDPAVRHAAIMVEDHPVAYADFEGQIPKGQYGGGEVLIWDEGVYAPIGGKGNRGADEKLVRAGLAEGKLEFVLFGERLKGAFILVRTKQTENWLLIKMHDWFESKEDVTKHVDSVRSHLTAEDLRAGRGNGAVWHSDRSDGEAAGGNPLPSDRTSAPASSSEHGSEDGSGKLVGRTNAAGDNPHPGPLPSKGEGDRTEWGLMVPVEKEKAFRSELWTFEPKLDGVRALAVKEDDRVQLLTRNDKDIAERFPNIVSAIRERPETRLVLDGELVILDKDGKPSFQTLMDAYHGDTTGGTVRYYVFDALAIGDEDLRKRPLTERRERLDRLKLSGAFVALDTVPTEGEQLYEEVRKRGFEGVVAKRLASPYRVGISDDWLKIKSYHSEEFLIGGYSPGTGGRSSTFGSLLLGRPAEDGKLRYVGNVGTGFDDEDLTDIHRQIEPLCIKSSPFVNEVPREKHPIYIEPRIQAEVRFSNLTREGMLRFPVFIRLRADRDHYQPPSPQIAGPGDFELVAALSAADREEIALEIEGHRISFSSLNKQLWPGITKREFLRYLAEISGVFLPYLRDRPLTFVRFPDGIGGEGFFQRHWDKKVPEFVEMVGIFSKHNEGVRQYTMCNNLATLMWLGQLSALELHPYHSRIDGEGRLPIDFGTAKDVRDSALNYPDYLVCDLDPNIRSGREKEGEDPELNEVGWARTVEVALGLKSMLDTLKIKSFVKTTGKTGLHIYIPVVREYDSDQIKEAARTIGEHLMKRMPGKITMEIRLDKRPAVVFFDANMNGFGRTLASAFSPRPVEGGRISMPISWDQLPNVHPQDFTISTAPKLIASRGDAWHDFLSQRNRLAG